ncbi:hypothetical protein BCR35DRAFT_303943 [Leucosporidium creatinivorum]|uniref:Uncharacterized protein n=1 Tax=Leucosporidium creatinivorum TaxID=106004 RepID=A0A1Y2FCY4_9BASI|nr:hypothetical protein BCR35DRAFT_303943 [Leucosporidium creatinivorum]
MATEPASPTALKPPPINNKRTSPSPSRWSSLSLLALALLIVYHFHLDWTPTLPKIQAIAYPAGEGEDITYGLRISLGAGGGGRKEGEQQRSAWQFELGKIGDDGLRQRVLNQEVGVGLSDSFWYFKVVSGEDTHLLLASLWQANLITRREAEAVLGKGPIKSPSTSLAPVIHRIPSLATLTAAYYTGAHVGTRVILGKVTIESRVAPVAVGAAAVGGAVLVFSRSSRGTTKKLEEGSVDLASFGGGAVGPLRLPGGGKVDLSQVKILSQEECRACPCFGASAAGASFDAASAEVTSPLSPPEDWLQVTAESMWGEECRKE